MAKLKNIIILSEKSSGSSACQNLLARFADIRHITKTRHFENETLYWTKAASVLGKYQMKMVDSEVPIEPQRARSDLIDLLTDNLDDYKPPTQDKALISQGWRLLCEKYAPIFVEKSPHHLCQRSALELILENIHENKEIDFLLLGLIRNPMSTIYSQYKRWGSRPEKVEKQWFVAYENLGWLKEVVGEKLFIIRYEDMVSSLRYLKPVLEFCEVPINDAVEGYLHSASLNKWRTDRMFGFSLSNETVELSERYGYPKEETANDALIPWAIASRVTYASRRISTPLVRSVQLSKQKINSYLDR